MSRHTGSEPTKSKSTPTVDTTIFLQKTGGTLSGLLDMGRNKIINIGAPSDTTDATNKQFVETHLSTEISKPNVINTSYTLAKHNDNITVGRNSITTRVNDALTSSDIIEQKKIVEINLSFHQLFGASFFLNGNGMGMFGQFNDISGYVHSAQITVVQPTAWHSASTLTSVQMMMSNESDPTAIQSNLTNKLTRRLAPGTYNLTPLETQFSNLKYIAFLFEGGDATNQIEFTAKIVFWITI